MCTVAKINTNGDISIETLDSEFVDYNTLSEGVGGMIEAVTLNNFDLWCNEEGLYANLPINTIATQLWDETYPNSGNVILGNVVITGGCDDEGETLGLNHDQIQLIEALQK